MLYTNPSVAAYDLGIYAQQAIDRYLPSKQCDHFYGYMTGQKGSISF